MAKIVAIDPDPVTRDQYAKVLAREGHDVLAIDSGTAGLDALRSTPDLVLMDLDQSDMDGNELLRTIRRSKDARATPVMIVTARFEEVDRIVAFELGADDFVAKPFSGRELGLRVRAILRRRTLAPIPQRAAGEGRVRIDRSAHRAWVDEREVALSVLEFRILSALCDRRSGVQKREELLELVWGNESGVSVRSVDAYVKRLRRKLGAARHCIETVRGVGYRLSARSLR